jgi:hypothetical protein
MYRSAAFYFVLLALFAVAGFWPSYLSRFGEVHEFRVHYHGIATALWIVLLITQAYLMRSGRRATHRRVGRISFVLAPLIVFSIFTLAHVRLHDAGAAPSEELLYFFYVQLSLITLFALAYALAIFHRRDAQRHARYMICTALTPIDPILARMFFNHLGIDRPIGQYLTYAIIDLILLALIYWDWRNRRRLIVFPAMLALFVVAQIPTFFFYQQPWWKAFAVWYGQLPLP